MYYASLCREKLDLHYRQTVVVSNARWILLAYSSHLVNNANIICFEYCILNHFELVFATGPNSPFGSGSGSDPEPDRCNGLLSNTRHFKSTLLRPIKYLSSDSILTWTVCRLCCFSHSFGSCSHICDWNNICWVDIENPLFFAEISLSFTAIQRILVQSQIWQWEVEEGLTRHNMHIYHIVIRSEPKYLIVGKVAGTVIRNHCPGPTGPWIGWVLLFSGKHPQQQHPVRFQSRTTAWSPGTVANTTWNSSWQVVDIIDVFKSFCYYVQKTNNV
jgi:hypothetical protein